MKVLFFRHSLLSRGGDKMIVLYSSYMAQQGHEVLIKSNLVDTVFPLDSQVRIERLQRSGKLGTMLSAVFGITTADVVIADIIPMICLLMFRNRKKLVYFAQDYDESYYDSKIMQLFIRAVYLFALKIMRVPVVAVSSDLVRIFNSRFGARAVLVENGIDDQTFYNDPSETLVGEKSGRKAVLLLSRSDKRKGFDIAVEVVNKALRRCAGFEVWTVGEHVSGMFHGQVHRDFGYVKEEELRRIMSSADILLYPSRHEGYPLMVLEAFACGLPVVTTAAVPFARHEENAMVAKIGDVRALAEMLISLLDSSELSRKLSESGMAFAGLHSVRHASANFESYLVSMQCARN